MSILIYALIVLIVAGIAAVIVRRIVPEYGDIASLIVLLVAVLVIASHAGVL